MQQVNERVLTDEAHGAILAALEEELRLAEPALKYLRERISRNAYQYFGRLPGERSLIDFDTGASWVVREWRGAPRVQGGRLVSAALWLGLLDLRKSGDITIEWTEAHKLCSIDKSTETWIDELNKNIAAYKDARTTTDALLQRWVS